MENNNLRFKLNDDNQLCWKDRNGEWVSIMSDLPSVVVNAISERDERLSYYEFYFRPQLERKGL